MEFIEKRTVNGQVERTFSEDYVSELPTWWDEEDSKKEKPRDYILCQLNLTDNIKVVDAFKYRQWIDSFNRGRNIELAEYPDELFNCRRGLFLSLQFGSKCYSENNYKLLLDCPITFVVNGTTRYSLNCAGGTQLFFGNNFETSKAYYEISLELLHLLSEADSLQLAFERFEGTPRYVKTKRFVINEFSEYSKVYFEKYCQHLKEKMDNKDVDKDELENDDYLKKLRMEYEEEKAKEEIRKLKEKAEEEEKEQRKKAEEKEKEQRKKEQREKWKNGTLPEKLEVLMEGPLGTFLCILYGIGFLFLLKSCFSCS